MPVARTNVPPEEQIRNIAVYDDTVAAGSSMETTSGSLEDNLQAVISQINRALNGLVAGNNWYVDPPVPATFEGGAVRGTIDLNQDLHDLERKRILKREFMDAVDVPNPGMAQVAILDATDLPTVTTAAIGSVTTLGTVVAQATVFGTAGLEEVVGVNPLQPRNLVYLYNTNTGNVVTRASDGRQIYGLFQSESGTDGSTLTGTTPNRVQISFVVRNSTNDDLELVTAGDMDGISFDYAYVVRDALQDWPEQAWLNDEVADLGSAISTRQSVYDNQGASAVTTTSNATLDIGSGFAWEIGNASSAALIALTGGTPATPGSIGAIVDLNGGAAAAGLEGGSPTTGGTGGSLTADAGTGGAADASATPAEGANAGAGGVARIAGGLGGLAQAGISPGLGGTGGAGLLSGGIGGDADGTDVGGELGGDGGGGGSATVSGGRGGDGAAGTTDAGQPGAGGNALVTGGTGGSGAGTSDNGNAGLVLITAGTAGTGGSGAAGTAGSIQLRTSSGPGTTITQATDVVRFVNQGTGTGGGQTMEVYTGIAAPTHAASSGSIFLYDDNTEGRLYLNESSGGAGMTWTRVLTEGQTVTRNFFQDTLASAVAAGNPITAADLTGGVIAVKPSSSFTFDTDAMVFLNGILLLNGSGNEVSNGAGNNVNIEATGPSAQIGDVLTIIYYTNSTSNTA